MKITLELPDHITERIAEVYFNKFGGMMGFDQLNEFLRSDMIQVYISAMDMDADNTDLEDALDMFQAD